MGGPAMDAILALPLLVDTARPDPAPLPAEDLIEPGDEVPTLAELYERLHTLAAGAASAEQLRQVEERVAVLEARERAEHAPTPSAPTAYRDRDGHIWEAHGFGYQRQGTDNRLPNRHFLEGLHGPITPLPATSDLGEIWD